jgi:hypothetical protein
MSAFDMGDPSRFPIKATIIVDRSGETRTRTIALPTEARDTEAAVMTPAVSQKTAADSPIYA